MPTKRSWKRLHQSDFYKINCHFIPLLSKKFFGSIDLNGLKLSLTNNFGTPLRDENLLIAKIRTVELTSVNNCKCIALVTSQVNNRI